MNPHYPLVARRAGHRCEYCHAPEVAFNFAFEIEHVRPPAAGGTDHEANLALGCRSCNLYKSDDTAGVDPLTGETVQLFHPRTDRWDEHFFVEPDSSILATTAIGRATIDRLRMNSARQIFARQKWRLLRLFP
ncbi:MAG TPA: HNH endonuclease signature motif containing protein [Tepidisphaeraceae bacterium]|nr:HNH endonuclease signature motif containing protein [Tepidisphaeraceae bacterium]